MISWILDEAIGNPEYESLREITLRVLTLNFAAIHTSTTSTMAALYTLAAHPEIAHSLREELLKMVQDHGWNKQTLDECELLDSFLKETQRHSGVSAGEFLTCAAISTLL